MRLLEVDPDLAAGLSGHMLEEAWHHAIVPLVELDAGPWRVEALSDADCVRGDPVGFLLLTGMVTMDVCMADRWALRLIVPQDLVLLDGVEEDSVSARWQWTVLETTRIVVLDRRLLAIGQRWPPLLAAILKRAAHQTRHAFMQQAISQLPRVEDRLLALLWVVADRQGVVRTDGVWVHLPVTHDTLARMIGARRPTVSLGLRTLAERGLLRAEDDGWLIARASLAVLGAPDV